jgi:hypothetical protein
MVRAQVRLFLPKGQASWQPSSNASAHFCAAHKDNSSPAKPETSSASPTTSGGYVSSCNVCASVDKAGHRQSTALVPVDVPGPSLIAGHYACCLAALLRLAYVGVTNALAMLGLLPISDRAKDAEILALRHQIVVLERQLHGEKVRFAPAGRSPTVRRPAAAHPALVPDEAGDGARSGTPTSPTPGRRACGTPPTICTYPQRGFSRAIRTHQIDDFPVQPR